MVAKLERKLATPLERDHRKFLLHFGRVEICTEWDFRNSREIREDPHGIISTYVEYPRKWERLDLPVEEIGRLVELASCAGGDDIVWHPQRKEFFLVESSRNRLISCGPSFITAFNAFLDTNEGIAPPTFEPVFGWAFPPKANKWGSMLHPGIPAAPTEIPIPSIDQIIAVFQQIPFQHIFRNDEMLHLFSISQQIHVQYTIQQNEVASCSLALYHFQSKKLFQKLMSKLKPQLIEAGFGHSFRPWPPELFPGE